MDLPKPSPMSAPGHGIGDFPDRLSAWMGYLSWSKRSIAASSGVSRGLVAKWLNGDSSPTMASAHRVVETLGVSGSEFFSETPGERVFRCLMATAMAAGDEGRVASLSGIRCLTRRDFVAFASRVPLGALPLVRSSTDVEQWLSGEGLQALVELPLFEPERYPEAASADLRRPRVAASLQELEDELRRWRYQSRDRALIRAAISIVEEGSGDPGEQARDSAGEGTT